jgi:phospholipase C
MPTNSANPAIQHVFVLMLENRSFDHMLGFLNNDISNYSNSYKNISYPATHPADYIMPYDPGHEFPDVLEQLCGATAKYPSGGPYPAINNSGFVSDYATTKSKDEGGATSNFGEIMKCYTSAEQLPVMTALVNNFALCDQWYSSLPGPTWPNRFFVHAASSGGLDHSPTIAQLIKWETVSGFSFRNNSIYHLLDKYKKKYRLYRGVTHPLAGCIPGVAALKGIQIWDTHNYKNFERDINHNYPYSYTFIEPNYGNVINNTYSNGQSQHPMDDVRGGEALIKSTYEALRNSPIWKSSLLIITYDEHGGFYDHIPPPAAIAPGDTKPNSKYNQNGFTFKQYGVRVPALVVSAYTPNTIDHTLYDHSSVPATLEAMFKMPALTQRDANANNVTSLASLPEPGNTPLTLPDVATISIEELEALREQQHPVDEETTTADSGNLPGFLHIVLKGRLEREPTKSLEAQTAIIADFSSIRTRADARRYIEDNLPGLLPAEEELALV